MDIRAAAKLPETIKRLETITCPEIIRSGHQERQCCALAAVSAKVKG
jgi:hypothetical protein